jgi:hypothetical protein
MKAILRRMNAAGEFEIVHFGDDVRIAPNRLHDLKRHVTLCRPYITAYVVLCP